MTNHEHERAVDLITQSGVEDIAPADAAWLESHLARCSECAEYAGFVNSTGQLLRSVAVTASPELVATTQSRVHARATYLREQRSRMVLVAISFCLGAMSSAVSAWLWWRFGAWVAQRLGLPSMVVEPGLMVFLLLPAVVIAVLILAFPHPVVEGPLLAALPREREGVNQ